MFGPLEPGMQEAIDDGLEPALDEAGTEIAVDGSIPFGVPSTAAVAAVVSRFKSEDVGAVSRSAASSSTAFMTEAQRQDYHPTYVMSDMSEGTDDLILRRSTEQLANAIGELEGQGARPVPTEADKACIDTYAPDARGSVTQEIGAAQICQLLDLVRLGLEGAGDDLTRGSFVEAMEGIGDFTTSGGGQASYGPDDHTMPDQVRLVRFDLEGCRVLGIRGDWIDVDEVTARAVGNPGPGDGGRPIRRRWRRWSSTRRRGATPPTAVPSASTPTRT